MLTNQQAEEIRFRLIQGETVANLATKFHGAKTTLYLIKYRISFNGRIKKIFNVIFTQRKIYNGQAISNLSKLL